MPGPTEFTALGTTLGSAIKDATAAAAKDSQLQAFLNSEAITEHAIFGAQAAGSESAVLIDVSPGKITMREGNPSEASFVLSALPEQWQKFFKQTPDVPYQSYWGVSLSIIRRKSSALRSLHSCATSHANVYAYSH